jgi:hypothetical protein
MLDVEHAVHVAALRHVSSCCFLVLFYRPPAWQRGAPDLSKLLFAGTCAKQSYQAVVGTQQAAGRLCSGTLFKDHDGTWRCAEGLVQEPCSSSFTNTTEVIDSLGARCMQVCRQ